MKHLVYILLGLMLVGVFSCRRSPGGTEARLVAIDSLVSAQPDSALSLLADINADSLPADLRAYHDVLTTQALYKAYIPATTDTLIARAWSYYRDHGPYDRRIRAMLYSGTTAEELGHPDSAMRWYKRTEDYADHNDHFNLGYSIMRQAALYQSHFETKFAIAKYKLAYSHFIISKNIHYELDCVAELGALYRLVNNDSALKYITTGIKIAQKNGNVQEYYTQLTSLTGFYLKNKDFNHAINTARKVLDESDDSINRFRCIHYACEAYCYLGKIDSATEVFNLPYTIKTTADSILHLETLSLLKKTSSNSIESLQLEMLSNSVTERVLLSSKGASLHEIEETTLSNKLSIIKTSSTIMIGCIIAFAFLLLALCILFLYREKRNKNDLQVLKDDLTNCTIICKQHGLILQKQMELISSIELLAGKKSKNTSLALKEIYNAFYGGENGAQLWNELKAYSNFKYNNIIDLLESKYPTLTEKDLRLIILICCDFSDNSIKTILQYTNIKSLYNRKRLLPIEKMGKNATIKEVIEEFRQNPIFTEHF